jgi:hypothetical protein
VTLLMPDSPRNDCWTVSRAFSLCSNAMCLRAQTRAPWPQEHSNFVIYSCKAHRPAVQATCSCRKRPLQIYPRSRGSESPYMTVGRPLSSEVTRVCPNVSPRDFRADNEISFLRLFGLNDDGVHCIPPAMRDRSRSQVEQARNRLSFEDAPEARSASIHVAVSVMSPALGPCISPKVHPLSNGR